MVYVGEGNDEIPRFLNDAVKQDSIFLQDIWIQEKILVAKEPGTCGVLFRAELFHQLLKLESLVSWNDVPHFWGSSVHEIARVERQVLDMEAKGGLPGS